MYEALVARIRYHIQKANFMGLKEAESTLLLGEAADAFEELTDTVKRQSEILRQYGGETGIRQAFESADGWAKVAAEYRVAYIAEHDARIAECKRELTEKEQEAHNAFLAMAARCGQAEPPKEE